MPRLAQMITENMDNCDILQLANAIAEPDFRLYLFYQQKLHAGEEIRICVNRIRQIAIGKYKPTLLEMNQLINRLEVNINAFVNPLFGNRGAPIEYSDRTIEEFATVRIGQEEEPLVARLQAAANGCAVSFQVYALYPYDREHKNPVQGNSLPESGEYALLRELSGDALKTAILEVMFEKLAAATTDNFADINDEIIFSPAYRILSTSQSKMGVYSLFNSGKTTSRSIIDNQLEQKRVELGLQPNQVQPMV